MIYLTLERLQYLLSYDRTTGEFRRLVNAGKRGIAGTVPGSLDSKGYRQIKIDGRLYLAHRLAWLYVHGRWPDDELDHRDGNHANNQINNLRECSHGENAENYPIRKDNKSGFTGVGWHEGTGMWRALINKNRIRYCLGYHETKEAAYSAYLKAKQSLHRFQPVPRDDA